MLSRIIRSLIIVLVIVVLGGCNQSSQNASTAAEVTLGSGLPMLVDLGADKCVPCKQMKPILDNLTEEYAGRMDVIFIDVWENRDQAARFNVRMIPTQIFYDKDGKELYRRVGFIGKEDILATWKELGYTF
ncbi:MAG: thioredoxin family protein [Pelovirga sp.]